MKYILSEKEYEALQEKAHIAKIMKLAVQNRESTLSQIGVILHEILGTKEIPAIVDGYDCLALARLVKKKFK